MNDAINIQAEENNNRLVFKFRGLSFETSTTDYGFNVGVPLCPSCHIELVPLDSVSETSGTCVGCGKKYDFGMTVNDLRGIACQVYEGKKRSQKTIITLDSLSNIKDEEKDEEHHIKVYLSQKNGQKSALIYIIKRDGSGNKAQIFADLEKEEVRYDQTDLSPGSIIAKMKIEFPHTEHEITYKKERAEKDV